MAIARNIVDKIVCRIFARSEYESIFLRSYFEKNYDIDIGLYTIGAFDRWRIPPGTKIGRYCSIAKSARLLDANHPMNALSTHPYFYLKQFGIVERDLAKIQPPVIEDDVWLGHNSIITPSCHHIGRGAVIGAGAVVMSNVPPYAIMAGSPARLVRYRFPPETIAALEASEWWLLDREALTRALGRAPGFTLTPSPDTAVAFLRANGGGRALEVVPTVPADPIDTVTAAPGGDGAARLMALLKAEVRDFSDAKLDLAFEDLGVDSFGLINLRTAIETDLDIQIGDRDWGEVITPADVLRVAKVGLLQSKDPKAPQAPTPVSAEPSNNLTSVSAGARPAGERRVQPINMPQMALSGLSEAWLFKEIGDIHWSVLTRGLRTPSSAISDSEGNRLYATFTRISLEADAPLTAFRENDTLILDLGMSRYGAGMFFSEASIEGAHVAARARLMTSFARFGDSGANSSLLKGQPVIPNDCDIVGAAELPAFAQEYRAQRAQEAGAAIYESEYEILPPHDINGVGLLYFAAYPTIIDICALGYSGRRLANEFSTTGRDVYYFANSAPDETLVFRLHRWDETDDAITFDATLSRKSDKKVMAWVRTMKGRVAAAPKQPGADDLERISRT